MTRQQELADLARQWALPTPDASDIPAVLAFLADVRARRNRAEHQAIVDRQAIVYGVSPRLQRLDLRTDQACRPPRGVPMTAFIGVDPSSAVVGLALLSGESMVLRSVRWLPTAQRTYAERLRPVVDELTRLAGGRCAALLESPPPTTRAQGRKGSQAVVGFGVGRAWGLAAAALIDAGHDVSEVEVLVWRRTRDLAARRLRVGTPAEAGRGFVRPEDAATDRQKAFSWAVAAALWPGPVGDLVAEALRSARTQSIPWRLSGVSDACEAGLIALHARNREDS